MQITNKPGNQEQTFKDPKVKWKCQGYLVNLRFQASFKQLDWFNSDTSYIANKGQRG